MSSKSGVLALLVGAALSLVACGGTQSSLLEPAANTAQPPAYSEWSGGGKLGKWGDTHQSSCKPLKAESKSEDIDFRGGEVKVGPHVLTILPGALLRKTRITATISADSVNSVSFAPEGLHFLLPAKLSLSYANCKSVLQDMKVVYTTNDLLVLLELIPSHDFKFKNSVTGLISHFSRYAVAY